MSKNVLNIKNLKVVFPNRMGIIRAVEGIDIRIEKGKCVALVGESGCGKSVTSLAAMKLLGPSAMMRVDEMTLCGEDITKLTDKEMQDFRGKKISMIFQDALSALNPVMTIGKQLDEVFLRHFKAEQSDLGERKIVSVRQNVCHLAERLSISETAAGNSEEKNIMQMQKNKSGHLQEILYGKRKLTKKEVRKHSIELLRLVGVSDPERRYKAYPHELSGGMRQRVLIAMAFACRPDLIIADEPTTALDVTVQAQVLKVLSDMQKQNGTSLLLITHDLSVVVHMADEIYVMYSGKIVEKASTHDLFQNPLHPYTKGLIASVAKMDDEKGEFVQIPDSLPNPMHKPKGCYFHPRCPYAGAKCKESMPPIKTLANNRQVRCWEVEDE